ncbi:MAG: YdcF family protein [Cyanobacteria bacterium P01_G01_bin.49]
MEILIAFTIIWILWLISSKRYRKFLVQPLAVMVVGFVVITSPAFVNLLTWGLTVAVPSDPGDRVDTIVVLGRGSKLRSDRLNEVWQLWQDQRAANIFASGMMDAKPMVRYLQDNGVPNSHVAGEECSQTTEENGLFTSAILRQQGTKKILLVTDPSHMWRSLLVFRSVGFKVIPHFATSDFQQQTISKHLFILAREYLALADYALTGKFRQRSPSELDKPSSEITQKIHEWNCQTGQV